MPSVIDLCNNALDKLGQSPIVSLIDGSKAANLCNRNWPLIRDRVLRRHPWNFATERAELASEVGFSTWDYAYRYPMPADCLRVLQVDGLSTDEYVVEKRAILSNESPIRIRYIARVEDPNQYDTLVQDAMALALAVELCEPMTQSTTKKEMLLGELNEALIEAKRIDGQENPPARYEEDDWISARY